MRRKLVPELFSSDIDRSLRFYVGLLRFSILYARAEDRFAYLDLDGAQLMLEQPTGRAWLTGEMQYPFGRGINLQIEVADADALHATVGDAGQAIYLPIEERWYRRDAEEVGQRQFIVMDPDGYLLRFCTPLGARGQSSGPDRSRL